MTNKNTRAPPSESPLKTVILYSNIERSLCSLPSPCCSFCQTLSKTKMGKKRVLISYGVDVDAVAGWLGSVRAPTTPGLRTEH